jgi:hypothetical protein
MNTTKIKIFDVVIHPRLETSWIHFDIEATDEKGKIYYDRSSGYGGYAPPYPAFPCCAPKNHFTTQFEFGYFLETFDVNQIIKRLGSYQWEAAIKSIKFSSQVYVCPKTYIVWKSFNEKVEGNSYYEIKELPKNRKDFYVCREQQHDVYQAFKQ